MNTRSQSPARKVLGEHLLFSDRPLGGDDSAFARLADWYASECAMLVIKVPSLRNQKPGELNYSVRVPVPLPSSADPSADRRTAVLRLLVQGSIPSDESARTLDVEDIVRRLGEQIDREVSQGPESLGPFYDTQGLSRRWGISRSAINARVQRHRLLAVPSDGHTNLYPLSQFKPGTDAHPEVVDGGAEMLAALANHDKTGLSAATWMGAQSPELDGQSAWQWLQQGRDPRLLLDLLESDAKRWSR